MNPAKTSATVAFAFGAMALLACTPSSDPKTPDGKNVDVSHIGEPPPVTNQEAPDLDFLVDMAGRSGRQALKCDAPEIKGPRETATVDVTFEPTGWSGEVVVHKPHDGTPMGECIKRAFEKVSATNFKGSPVVITQTIDFAKKDVPKGTPPGGMAAPSKSAPDESATEDKPEEKPGKKPAEKKPEPKKGGGGYF
ncbi:MAG: hypothetical protein HY898_12720 [Deltaproteobacteria bacterium]|nr:hypothetical protein [Deltaproteobacteria bacterium]